ncbi:receptor-like protein 12 [Arachis ipaensis]|uniref:receptor-like protein 12 n=1 Tax=Arachis ipaensis TaxID=130454 RepID=UPI000A2B68E0|nr:receptor-like protein 12 [Arachis ipaensis]XP_025678717.1 receptor-like protein EIX2 [Arachis hypogaea]
MLHVGVVTSGCIESERQALLEFKAAMVDDYGMLSSWNGQDCCHWNGVGCNNLTGHVQSLDYDFTENEYTSVQRFLRGKIPNSLVELQHLRYLNLSSNGFEDYHIPEFFANFSSLRHHERKFANRDTGWHKTQKCGDIEVKSSGSYHNRKLCA